jgi:hypothetical protein
VRISALVSGLEFQLQIDFDNRVELQIPAGRNRKFMLHSDGVDSGVVESAVIAVI